MAGVAPTLGQLAGADDALYRKIQWDVQNCDVSLMTELREKADRIADVLDHVDHEHEIEVVGVVRCAAKPKREARARQPLGKAESVGSNVVSNEASRGHLIM
jgi:hypothetical protein